MKKLIALLLALVMVLALAACGEKAPVEEAPVEEAPVEEAPVEEAPEEGGEEAPAAAMTEEEAWAAAEAGTLVADDLTGYGYSDSTGKWYYSNYPNYKDFNADGKLKVAFVCKFSGAWFTPKAESLGETVEAAGCEYLYIDANSDEQAWLDGIQNIINQDFDAVVMTPVNTALLPDAIAMLQEAGIAYLTTDDPGADAYGFFSPHYGLDDYYLHNELGKYVASKMQEEGFMDGVAEDYSNFLFVLQDSPAVEAIHLRNVGFYDGIVETFAIPEDRVVWLDCGGSLSDEVAAKFSSTVQANVGTVEKWLVSAGGAASITPTMTLFKEAGVDLANVKFADCFSTDEPLKLMMSDPAVAACSYGACLSSAPSGVGMGNILIDLFENGTPIPAFTGYELIIADGSNAEQRYNEIYGG
ncbi:MAG: substrate-binding domain-containing protein [Oscillospiraceae bacterium]|nr:substrate-binding domain-containing protein [Oscillospiraceae bacterium]